MDELLPARGTSANLVARLRDYLSVHASEITSGWRGAPESLVERYVALAFGVSNRHPPDRYLEYARAFGAADGSLFDNFRIDGALSSLIELYEETLGSELESLGSEFPVVATYWIGDQISLDMRDPSVPEPPVVETSDGELLEDYASSWEGLLMQAAMLHVESRRLPTGRWASGAAGSIPRADAIAVFESYGTERGLASAWPSGGQRWILVGEDQSVFMKITAAGATLVHAFSRHPDLSHDIERALCVHLGTTAGGRLELKGKALVSAGR